MSNLMGGGGAVPSGQSPGQGKPAPRDARDMMMRDEEAAGSAGGMFSRLNIAQEIEKVKGLFPSNASMGKLVSTLGFQKKEDDSSKVAGASYLPPEMGDLTSDYVRMGGADKAGDTGGASTSTGTVTVEAKPAAKNKSMIIKCTKCSASLSCEPKASTIQCTSCKTVMHVQQSGSGSSSGSSQLRCYNCSVVMSYPPGVQQVRCPECSSINATSAAGQSKSSDISVSCCGCHKPTVCSSSATSMVCPHCTVQNLIVTCQNPSCGAVVSCSSGAAVMGCPACKTVNNIAGSSHQAPAEIHVTCVGCMCRLMMPATAPAVRCPKCTTITQRTDPRAKAAPATRPSPAAAASSSSTAQSEEEAIQEAIRRSLGQPARPMSSRGGGPSASAPETQVVDDAMMARALTTFTDITGCEPDVATEFLQSNGWRMEVAVNHYLEHIKTRSITASSSSPIQNTKSVRWNAQMEETRLYSTQQPAAYQAPYQAPEPEAAAAHPPAAAEQPLIAIEAEPETVEWRGIVDWLQSLGLEKYETILRAQELTDPDALRDVTDEDLKEMNISTIGARRKILAAIRKLNESKIVRVEVKEEPKQEEAAAVSAGWGAGSELDQIQLDVPQPAPSIGDIRVEEAKAEEVRSEMDLRADEEFVKPAVAENTCTVEEAKVEEARSEPIRSPEGVL
mmetsp:Transcript_5384/g.13690  ORF Transcript_5384/g.13690 Transcript_5384/m.13690 type:complete len:675 (+) Transcript_5384:70-2094(+)